MSFYGFAGFVRGPNLIEVDGRELLEVEGDDGNFIYYAPVAGVTPADWDATWYREIIKAMLEVGAKLPEGMTPDDFDKIDDEHLLWDLYHKVEDTLPDGYAVFWGYLDEWTLWRRLDDFSL